MCWKTKPQPDDSLCFCGAIVFIYIYFKNTLKKSREFFLSHSLVESHLISSHLIKVFFAKKDPTFFFSWIHACISMQVGGQKMEYLLQFLPLLIIVIIIVYFLIESTER